MTKPPEDLEQVRRRLLSPRKIAIQLVGFLIGVVLVVWCIKTAIGGGDWSKLRDADVSLIVALIGLGLLGTILDGAVFWAILRPYRNLDPIQVQGVNMTASLLNYAPIRIGTVFRIAYHNRVDGVPIIPILGWFAAITLTTMACLASVAGATFLTNALGVAWWGLLVFFLLASGVMIWLLARIPAIRRFGKGMERMFGDPQALLAGLVGRLFVLASGTGRMGVAAAILGLQLSISEVVLLSVAALVLSFNPLGRFGWREATVALVTAQFAAGSLAGQNVDGVAAQLALIESAGEALAIIPLGILTAIWATPRLLRSGSNNLDAATNSPGQSDEDHPPA